MAAGRADAQAAADDLASVRLSLQASLATAYFNLRGLDQQQKLLADTIDTYQRALKLTLSRHAGGIASDLDVSRARTQLDSARASAEDVRARRALYEHAIATLVGVPASAFSLAPDLTVAYLPAIPAGIPATLLQRRPDVAAAERRMAAANARIGVARAAFFPDITLGLIGGYQSSGLGHWLSAPNEIWSIGPSLALTLFDGGRRQAITDQAHAKLAENGAQYRAVVLAACQQVEDNLALTHHTRRRRGRPRAGSARRGRAHLAVVDVALPRRRGQLPRRGDGADHRAEHEDHHAGTGYAPATGGGGLDRGAGRRVVGGSGGDDGRDERQGERGARNQAGRAGTGRDAGFDHAAEPGDDALDQLDLLRHVWCVSRFQAPVARRVPFFCPARPASRRRVRRRQMPPSNIDSDQAKAALICSTSCVGERPNMRLNSRLNCEGLS